MMAKSREQDTGIKCEVNGQILDSCGKLMQTIKALIIRARDLQKEIVAQGRVKIIFFFFLKTIVDWFLIIGHCKCS
jgi:diacylglycerol kinase